MARINIEDQFWLEVTAVAAQRNMDPDKLAGNASRFFRYAQEKHKKGKYVSEEEFQALGFLEELIPMFAKRTPNGLQAAGCDVYFGWLEQKSEAGKTGGKASAQRPRDEKGRLLSKRDPNEIQAKPNAHQASSSSSSSSSKEEEERERASLALADPPLSDQNLENLEREIRDQIPDPVMNDLNERYGADWVQLQIPDAISVWRADGRNQTSKFAVYLVRWLINAEKKRVLKKASGDSFVTKD